MTIKRLNHISKFGFENCSNFSDIHRDGDNYTAESYMPDSVKAISETPSLPENR